ncbi:MAG: cation diffusion facilitator family transporter, partial [Ginsengibacter sp.]
IDPANMKTSFIAGIILNFAFVIVEVIAGLYNHSLSLLSDAGHNLTDVGTLALSLLAFKMVKVKSNDQYTYGYRKTSILVALFNSVVLLISIGIIVYEAINRLFTPQLVSGINISIIAGIGIIVNFASARLFFRQKESDLNIKSAYLHLMSDAIVSCGIVIGGIFIFYFGWTWLDPVLSIVIAIVILVSTWKLLKESLRLSLDGVPPNISIMEIRSIGMKITGVKDFHHIHVWAMSTTENALTGHLILCDGITSQEEQKIKNDLKHVLEHKNIHHVTLETETENQLNVAATC